MKKSLLSFVATAAFATIALIISTPASAHPGGLDKNGCHHDSKTGDYHCHQGQNKGMSFASEEAMQQGGRGTPMESNVSPKGEVKSRQNAKDEEPARSTKSRKLKDSNTEDKEPVTSKRAKTKEKADSDTSSKKTTVRKKAKASADAADDTDTKKTKKTSKKAKADKSDASATDKDTKPKKTKKKKKSSSTDDTAPKQ